MTAMRASAQTVASAVENGASKPRTKPPEVRRNELMDAAERLFLEKGVAATSVDDIVATADVAKGTFYVHFPSKEHLLAALQQRFATSFADLIDTAMNKRRPNDWRGRLSAWAKAGVIGYLDRVALHDVVFHEIHVNDRRLKHENIVVQRLAAFLEAGTRAKAWSVNEPHRMAVMLFSALHGVVDDALGCDPSVDRNALARSMETFLRKVVASEVR
jgi:AcrR family transcriptional regulator